MGIKFWKMRSENLPICSLRTGRSVWCGGRLLVTYPVWLIGGLYVVGSVLGWLLLGCLIVMILARMDHPDEYDEIVISPVIWLWIIGMIFMEVALIAGHVDFNLGTGDDHQVDDRLGQGLGGSGPLSSGWLPEDP